jgi:hypothetical protein
MRKGLAILSMVLLGCGGLSTANSGGKGSGGGGGGGGSPDPGGGGELGQPGAVPEEAGGTEQCGSEAIGVEVVAPNLLVVLDRSCSMKTKVGGLSKWQHAVDALTKLTAKLQGVIRFGLTLFPDKEGDACSQGTIPIPVGAGNEGKIQALLAGALAFGNLYYPNGPCVTNIDTAVQQAATDPAFGDPKRASFVLLISDGAQALCAAGGGDAGTTQTITQLRQKSVSTFVVGFGGAADASQLNVFADAGGKPSGDPLTRFYRAEDGASLSAALAKISKRTVGCVLKLKQAPPDVESLHVFFDKKEVAQDKAHKEGWDYDVAQRQLTLYGKACSDLEAGLVGDVSVSYGCKKPPPEKPGGPKCAAGAAPCGAGGECPAKQACLAGCCVNVVE